MSTNFSIVKKGYCVEEVDVYIASLEEVIRSYKDKDVAIKNAIISAQIAADNIIKNAELEAASCKMKAQEQVKEVQDCILKEKSRINEFKDDYNAIIKKYVTDFNESDLLSLYGKLSDVEEDLAKSKKGSNTKNVKTYDQNIADTKVIGTV